MNPFGQTLYALLLSIWISTSHAVRGRMHKVTDPSSITLPLNDETVLTCEMNLAPDRFRWRFFPLPKYEESNPNAIFNLNSTNYIDLPPHMYSFEKKRSVMTIKLTNYSLAGDYQCLAYYGASVVASIPDRISVSTLNSFKAQNNEYITASPGNTILWRCEPPNSNPPAYIDYVKEGNYIQQNMLLKTTSMILGNISRKDSGVYKCRATNPIAEKEEDSSYSLNLKVTNSQAYEMPRFIQPLKKTVNIKKGETAFLECSAIGTPVPQVTWRKLYGELVKTKTQLVTGGILISNMTPSDEGVYVCEYSNARGNISHRISLIYNEVPEILEGPNSTLIKEGENLQLECSVRGIPEPKITWLLNGENVLNDRQIESIGNKIYFSPIEKRHAGIIQCFAINSLGTSYGSGDLNVIPKQISSSDVPDDFSTLQPSAPNHKRRKHKSKQKHKGTSEMIPPSKPTISRLNDESVVVRWSVPNNDGLPIQFFKVQYRELGSAINEDGYGRGRSSRWKTTNLDIPPIIRSYEVNNLKPDHFYKFRIAAVYSNNDNKLSPKSDKFHLTRADFFARNPLPVPTLTHTETVNSSSIQIFWEAISNLNMTIDGYFINYIPASSAGDYNKVTVDGENTKTYIITHLQADTVYDIKMQSFNEKTASEFSQILKQKTAKIVAEVPQTTTIKSQEASQDSSDSNMYIFIGVGVIVATLLLTTIIFLIICRKWKQDKSADSVTDRNDKPAVEEINHHIQADANDYITKNLAHNGCALQPNKITITANPLAEADNKNQNMIELSCLSSQNNNCTASASTQDPHQTEESAPVAKEKHNNRENKRRKHNLERTSGENYV